MSEPQPWVSAEREHKTKLLWLIDSLTVGGAERLVVPFAREINRDRFDLHVCCLTTINGNAFEKQLRFQSAHFLNLGASSLRDVTAFRRLLAYLRERRIELIHSHLTYASIWGAA